MYIKELIDMTNTNILKSLVQAEMEMPTPRKDATNPHFNSKYSTLQELLRCVKPALLRHGIRMKMDIVTRENEVGAKITLQHISGEIVENEPVFMPVQKCTPQGRASAITYAERYAICACFSLAGLESDDDANTVEDEVKKSTMRVQKKVSEKNKSLCPQTGMSHKHDAQRLRDAQCWMFGFCSKNGIDHRTRKEIIKHTTGKESSTQLTIDDYRVLGKYLLKEYASSA
jgi:hypothetical protein